MSQTAPATTRETLTKYRWVICALLFSATTINYVDRNSLGVLKTILEKELNWSEADYGWIQFAFTAAYAAFPTVLGRLIDRFGVKISLAAALIMWSAMSMALGLVHTVIGFMIVRFLLGVAEAANFPASIKAIAMWFPQKERALATGLFNSGTNLGVMISFGTVWLAEQFGWQWAFVTIGALGFVWLIFWKWGFDRPENSAHVSPAELDYIQSGQGQAQESIRLPWTTLLRFKQIWPFLMAKFLTDPVWWFYLYWLPSYLSKERGRDPMKSALLIGLIYTGASLGSIVGGWFSGFLIGRGFKVGLARYGAMLLPAVLMPLSIVAYNTTSFELCVALISLATACHQAWSANVFTSATDLFPAKVSGSVVGLGATTGGLGGMFLTLLAAMSIQWTGNQKMIFIWAGMMHPLSLFIYWLWLRTDFKQADVDSPPDITKANLPLLSGGGLLALLGAVFSVLIVNNWEVCVKAAKLSGAAQAATAAGGVLIIGAALIYAGMPKKNSASS